MILPVHVPDLKTYRDSPTQFIDRSQPCPRCRLAPLERHGSRQRWIFTATERIRIPVFRLRCPGCGVTVTVLPDLLLPRLRYSAAIVEEAITAFLTRSDSYRQIAVRLSGLSLPEDVSATDALLTCPTKPSYQRIHAWVQHLAARAGRLTQGLVSWLLRLRPGSLLTHLLASPVPPFTAKACSGAKRQQLRDAALLRTLVLETPELAHGSTSSWLLLLHRWGCRPMIRGSPPDS